MSASAPPIGMRRPASAPMHAGGRGLQLVQGSAATIGLQSKGFGRVGGLSADQRHGAAQPVQPQELKQMQMSLLRSEIAFLLEGTRGAVRLQQLLERSVFTPALHWPAHAVARHGSAAASALW